MAQASIFISPRYNVGEKVAGGTLAIYTDNSQQQLVPLWRYADLKINTSDGSGAISNPVPIDNNGIISSPVFYDSSQTTGYINAYYVLRDAYGAIIRQGFVTPQSWQLTGNPIPPDNPWANTPVGDPYWGYEVIKGTSLVSTPGTIGRPLYYQPASGADRSGGLIVYFVPGSLVGVDNVLSFQGQGGVWISRDEWINYSYLRSALPANTEPFAWLNANYGSGIYAKNMNLDQCPVSAASSTVRFNNKVRIQNTLSQTSGNGNKVTVIIDEDRLELNQSGAAFSTALANNTLPIAFKVYGGSFSMTKAGVSFAPASLMAGADQSLIVTGVIDNLDLDGYNGGAFKTLAGTVIKNMVNSGSTTLDPVSQTFASQADIWRMDANSIANSSNSTALKPVAGYNNFGARKIACETNSGFIFIDVRGAVTAPLFIAKGDSQGSVGAVLIDTSKPLGADYEPTVLDIPVFEDGQPGEYPACIFQISTSPSDARLFWQSTQEYGDGTGLGIVRNSLTAQTNSGAYMFTGAIKLSPTKLSTLDLGRLTSKFYWPSLPIQNETNPADWKSNGSMTGSLFGFTSRPSKFLNSWNNPMNNLLGNPIIMANSKLLDIEGDGKTPILLKNVRKAKKCILFTDLDSASAYNGLEGLPTTWTPWATTFAGTRIRADFGAELIEDSIIVLDKLCYPVASRGFLYRQYFKNTTFRNCVFLGNHAGVLLDACTVDNCSFCHVPTALTDANVNNFVVLLGSGTTVRNSNTAGVVWELYGDGDGDNFRDIIWDTTNNDQQQGDPYVSSKNGSLFLFLPTGSSGMSNTGIESGAPPYNLPDFGKFNNNPCRLSNVLLNSNTPVNFKGGTVATVTGFNFAAGYAMESNISSSNLPNTQSVTAQLAGAGSSSNWHSFIRGGADVQGTWNISGPDGMPTTMFPGRNSPTQWEWSNSKPFVTRTTVQSAEFNGNTGINSYTNIQLICMPVVSDTLTYEGMGKTFTLLDNNANPILYADQLNTSSTWNGWDRRNFKASRHYYWTNDAISCWHANVWRKVGGSYQRGS